METIEEKSPEERDADKDNATKQFANAEKASAAEINHRGENDNSKTYMNKGGKDSQGPNFDKKSTGGDGDTGENAGVFK